jgi:glycosyltransferase involved in cell wall biosynthesis
MQSTILIVTDNLKEQINGVVTTFSNIEKLAHADGYNIVYFNPGQFSYIDCPGYPEVKLSWPSNIDKKIKEIAPDYIHIATEGPLGLAVKLWCDYNKCKYNTSYHTRFPDFLHKLYKIPHSLSYMYLRWFHSSSATILTTTETMVNDLKVNKFKGNIVSWTRGVNRALFKTTKRPTNTLPVLLSVGRISKEKGLDDFCAIDYPATKIVVGDGPYRSELERKYPDVKFVGAKTGAELVKYFAEADVFVFTSRTDTFGIVIIEAMSVGTPVAAYPVQGPIDIIEPGISGHMSEDLVASIDICLKLNRTNVKQASAKWTWEQCWTTFKQHLVKAR